MLQYSFSIALILIAISGFTDVLDGFVAKKCNCISNVGKVLDPLADKITLFSILSVITILEIIPVWIIVIITVKEIITILTASYLYKKNVVVFSTWYGKIATFLFYLAIGLSLFSMEFNILSGTYIYVYYLAVLCSVLAFVLYGRKFLPTYFDARLKDVRF
jgi:cardiolipin synthase